MKEKIAEKEAAEDRTTIYTSGTDISDVTEKIIAGIYNTSAVSNDGTVSVGFDARA